MTSYRKPSISLNMLMVWSVRSIEKKVTAQNLNSLAAALVNSQPIIIVTIQTFPFVLKAIEDSSVLKSRRYAIIADEAHSSQTGSTARQLKEVLVSGDIESTQR